MDAVHGCEFQREKINGLSIKNKKTTRKAIINFYIWHFKPLMFGLVSVWFMMLNTIFNNISAILWWSVLMVEETGENHGPATSH